ncbi:spore germination protein [Bacillus paramycoides]|uniref:spore germination protein n=1 Tax=Bacillus paramycoides TaxID=2026194 RepID=UPI003816969A
MPSVIGNLVVQNSNGSFNLGDFITFLQKKIQKLIMVQVHQMLLLLPNTFSGVSATNTFDSDVADQSQVGTA